MQAGVAALIQIVAEYGRIIDHCFGPAQFHGPDGGGELRSGDGIDAFGHQPFFGGAAGESVDVGAGEIARAVNFSFEGIRGRGGGEESRQEAGE